MKKTNQPAWHHCPVQKQDDLHRRNLQIVKMIFLKGASLDDPSKLFNSSLEARVWRAIDIHEGDKINEKPLQSLIRAVAALNTTFQPQNTKVMKKNTTTHTNLIITLKKI
jgi:hypothetical protein